MSIHLEAAIESPSKQAIADKSETGSSATRLRIQRIRASAGLRLTAGSCELKGSKAFWQEVPQTDPSLQPIVCLHDAGSGSREFRPLLDRCPPGSRLVFVDWSGYGSSMQADNHLEIDEGLDRKGTSPPYLDCCTRQLLAVVEHLGLQRPILLGSGFGAAVAIHAAATRPDLFAGLVLCQPAGLVTPTNDGLFSWLSGMAKRFKRQTSAGNTEFPIHRQALRQRAICRSLEESLAELDAELPRAQASLRAALGRLPCPVLFALSRQSRRQPLRRYLELLDPLMAKAPQHRFTVFSGGFRPLWDEPERFAQALTGFVQGLLPLEKHQHAWILTAVDWPTSNSNLWKCVHPSCPVEQILASGVNPNNVSGRIQRS